jgi:dGTPase
MKKNWIPTRDLAVFASHEEDSRGRLYGGTESKTRGCFQRDRDRIIHADAFRRLAYKTQVFVNHEGDFFRTRLTHSLEVAQIARSVCRYLRLNEDLGETLALAHDLGHPPFGHAGEDALHELMGPFGGFDHNAQSLRVITHLEARYAEFNGLNLTWETLEGVVKHNGPLIYANNPQPLPRAIAEYANIHDLELSRFAGPEAQVTAISDDIAYNNHDIDDGLRAGLFKISDINDVPLVGPIFADVKHDFPDASESRRIHEAVRRLIGAMVNDLIEETQRRIIELNPQSVAEIHNHNQPIASFSEAMRSNDAEIKKFLLENMYRHYKLNRMTSKGRRVVKDLFSLLVDEPGCLPSEWQKKVGSSDKATTAQIVADFVGGMTDRFALDEHRRLFDLQSRIS